MSRTLRILFLVAFVLVLFTGTVSAYEGSLNDVWVTEDGETKTYFTKFRTVGEFLEDQNIVIEEYDKLNLTSETRIIDNYVTKITITRAIEVHYTIDGGSIHTVRATADTATGSFIARLKKELDMELEYEGKLTAPLQDGDTIHLYTKNVVEIVSSEPVPYETQYQPDDTMEKGEEKVVQTGQNGIRDVLTKITYIGGREVSREIVQEAVTVQPVTHIIAQGTLEQEQVVPEQPSLRYSAVYEMTATAYTAGYESTGKRPGDKGYGITASGKTAAPGVVAVDPRVIPLGTKLFIEGYGHAVAADTGGAIIGYAVDLFYEKVSDALNFGRQKVTVYVLDD